MKFIHGSVEMDLPAGWEDRSTLLFVDPQPLVAPKSVKGPAGAAPPNLVVTFMAPPEDSLAVFLEAQVSTAIAPNLPRFQIVRRGDAGSLEDPMPFIIYAANPGQPIRQIVAARAVGDRVILVTGGALEAQFAVLEERALATLRSLTLRE